MPPGGRGDDPTAACTVAQLEVRAYRTGSGISFEVGAALRLGRLKPEPGVTTQAKEGQMGRSKNVPTRHAGARRGFSSRSPLHVGCSVAMMATGRAEPADAQMYHAHAGSA
jgi:hypothetical protein